MPQRRDFATSLGRGMAMCASASTFWVVLAILFCSMQAEAADVRSDFRCVQISARLLTLPLEWHGMNTKRAIYVRCVFLSCCGTGYDVQGTHTCNGFGCTLHDAGKVELCVTSNSRAQAQVSQTSPHCLHGAMCMQDSAVSHHARRTASSCSSGACALPITF